MTRVRITALHGTGAYTRPELDMAINVAFALGIKELFLVIEPEDAPKP